MHRPALRSLLFLLVPSFYLGSSAVGSEIEFFETHVRPILVEHCQECHGTKKQWAELRLDGHHFMLKGGESGPAVVPGDPAESRLIQVIQYSEDDSQMPPEGKLSDEQIASLTQWVARGAHWPKEDKPAQEVDYFEASKSHWAFQPIQKQTAPAPVEGIRAQGPIDLFVAAKLKEKGLPQSPRATPHDQLRRLAFDLTGLPPTHEEVEQFEQNPSDEAWAAAVDRYLASPRFGQKWGRHWLDLARYADTKGYVFTEDRRYPFAYTYRDYVINALNEDLPYNQFIKEQIAADLMPELRDQTALAALGYLTVGNRFLNRSNEIYDDRIDVTIRGLMGMTVTCARCHDHKFDPITMADYYGLYGVFASSSEPDQLPQIGESLNPEEYKKFIVEKEKREKKVQELEVKLANDINEEIRTHLTNYLDAVIVLRKFTSQLDPEAAKYEVRRRARDELSRFLLQADVNDPFFGPWRRVIGLTQDKYEQESPKRFEQLKRDIEQGKLTPLPLVKKAIDARSPVSQFDFAAIYTELLTTALGPDANWPESERAEWEALRNHLRGVSFPLPMSPDTTVGAYNRKERGQRSNLIKKVDELIASSPGAPPRAMVINDKPTPVKPRIFKRGNQGSPGDQVERRFLSVLSNVSDQPFTEKGSGRLELANAIAADNNPLTGRVMVNRVWMHLIGSPLVNETSDFGLRTAPPTHPQLLDDLTARWIEQGWSVKGLIREIVLSETYRQTSEASEPGTKIDLENVWLWRMNRKRLPFESLRDSLLQAAGVLNESLGGRPEQLEGANPTHRRAIYGYIDRNNVSSLLRQFDVASPNTTVSMRSQTTVPQQSLFLMNSSFMQQMAGKLAERVLSGADPNSLAAPETEQRLNKLYHLVYQRNPSSEELSACQGYLENAEQKATAWQELTQVFLLTNEFAFID